MLSRELLDIRESASAAEIEAAYDRQMSRWQPLLSHPTRSQEAEEMIARLDAARRDMLNRLDTGEGGLRVEEAQLRSTITVTRRMDKDACPNCGYRENPSRARFCIDCQASLTSICPNPQCKAELPWHQDVCDQCGANIETFLLEQEEIQANRERLRELEDDLTTINGMSIPLGQSFRALKSKYNQELGCGQGAAFALMWTTLSGVILFVAAGNFYSRNPDPFSVNPFRFFFTIAMIYIVPAFLFYVISRFVIRSQMARHVASLRDEVRVVLRKAGS